MGEARVLKLEAGKNISGKDAGKLQYNGSFEDPSSNFKLPASVFTDTHCHIQEEAYDDSQGAYERALAAGVHRMIVIGTDIRTSEEAVAFASTHDAAWAAAGIHPHEAEREGGRLEELRGLLEAQKTAVSSKRKAASKAGAATNDKRHTTNDGNEEYILDAGSLARSDTAQGAAEQHTDALKISRHEINEFPKSKIHNPKSTKIVAIGEIGLDYYYDHSPRDTQIKLLEAQIELALQYNLPISFHVRDGFEDFWPVFDNFHGVRGVLHSFTDNAQNLQKGLDRDLWIGLNGIATFARERDVVNKMIPLSKILLETDAPYLTPAPHRGKINEPALLMHIANHYATLQSINLEELSQATERSATHLFSI